MTDAPQIELPPRYARISDFVGHYARRSPGADALVLGDQRVTYAALHTRIERLARAFIGAGVQKGDRIATLATPSPDYFVCFLAAVSVGAIWVGLNPRYQLQELEYVVSDSQPVLLLARSAIGERDYTPELSALKAGAPGIRQLVILDEDTGKVDINAIGLSAFLEQGERVSDARLQAARSGCGGRDACMIVYTSGSTGRPKGALLHHEGVVAFSIEQNRLWPVSPLRTLNYFPINHIGCVVDLSCPTLVVGGTIVFMESFSPRESLQLIQDEGVTMLASVPSVFQLQYAVEDFEGFDLSALQLIVWEGAAMPADLLTRLLEHGAPLATNYGMTESCGAITAVAPMRDKEILTGTVGWPFKGVEVCLVGGDGEPVAPGETGEILARSIYNMLGYWKRPDATRETLSEEGWLATGDLGRENPDGSYTIVGRSKEMYKSGGYNVYPREVEDILESHASVEMAAVVSVPDPVWQEVGVAYILAKDGLEAGELESFCRTRLANYKIPKRIMIMSELPLLPIGKVDKVALRKRASDDMSAGPAA